MTHQKASRRTFLKHTAGVSAMAGLMSGLPSGWVGSVYADDSPETKAMRFGIIALTDCSPAGAKLNVHDGWSRATGQAESAAAYVTIFNQGDGGDRLVGAETSASSKATIHSSSSSC